MAFSLDSLKALPDNILKIVLKMNRGCLKSIKHIRDTCDKAYLRQKCLKKNDIEVCNFRSESNAVFRIII